MQTPWLQKGPSLRKGKVGNKETIAPSGEREAVGKRQSIQTPVRPPLV
ncbi:hypothetical protein RSSM_04018 [Rhodopirellula sallentina SM41]|uniref:Uncharacterized protein n=1 Tax=Rhodopirellula sallentina SM41 TaxID=1263870 RepID=M5TZA8_9BACT|nr:hypothetical protein RSSM_04018 [Rhodopirellula sallentina SM41]